MPADETYATRTIEGSAGQGDGPAGRAEGQQAAASPSGETLPAQLSAQVQDLVRKCLSELVPDTSKGGCAAGQDTASRPSGGETRRPEDVD
eukprot:9110107-Pyramimonas_sp.AAC.1